MDQNTNRTTLKIFGVIMLLFGIVYGVVGSLALAGTLQGILPGHQTQEILVIVLAYGVALLAIICGILCLKNVAAGAMVTGIILALLGLAGLIYNQIALDSFNLFDMLGLLFGVSIAATAMKLKK
mgnify:FL=1